MSLADELLADFEDDDDVQAPTDQLLTAIPEENDDHEVDNHQPMEVDVSVKSVTSIAKLLGSERLNRVMKEIDERINKESRLGNKDQIDGPIETHPEYLLIVESNNLAVEIDHEITIVEKFVKEKYSKRFPELESLIPISLDYVRTVYVLGNDLSQVKSNEKLFFLNNATMMILSVTASTTAGKPLPQNELNSVLEACDMAVQLNECKGKILSFVESQMSVVAPNVSAIAGANVAAKLMALAGGLSSLSKMPACNVEVLGSKRKQLAGFSSSSILPHTGFVFESEIVQSMPPDLRRKAARLVANKCTIAARVDAQHAAVNGSAGSLFKEQILKALERLQEPPPVKQVKALPAPIDVPGKKRGGKRVRRQKERLAMSEFRKQQNRMNFGDIEDDAYQNDLGFTTGTIGKSGKGRIRAPQVDEKTKVRISKALQKNLQKQNTTFGGTTTVRRQVSGTASSVAFTPLQGLEIVNPGAAEAQSSSDSSAAKYFSNTGGFASVKK